MPKKAVALYTKSAIHIALGLSRNVITKATYPLPEKDGDVYTGEQVRAGWTKETLQSWNRDRLKGKERYMSKIKAE